MPIEQQRVAEDFNRAAFSYDAHATLQHSLMVDACLLASEYFKPNSKILDVGCGTGAFALHTRDYNKEWNVVGVDIAPAMVELASKYSPCFVGNATDLPFNELSFDGVFSGVCLQWVSDKQKALSEMARVIKQGGRGVITSFGARTLRELRDTMCAVGMPYSVMEMPSLDVYVRLAKLEGWKVLSAQQSTTVEYVASVEEVMRQLKRIGATNKHKDRPRHLFGVRRFERMLGEYEKLATPLGIPVTWDVISLVLEKA
ncbi:MAG: methyltransferase domain-containing protein [Alphaproteobacteria bacterium]|nr:methyltransferase domain-containing protein [Alphaproteobacteria bacterium]